MGIPSGKPADARDCHGAGGADDPRQADGSRVGRIWRGAGRLIALALSLWAAPAGAEVLRIATWNVGLERAGPGLLLRDITKGEDAQVRAVVQGIAALDADVILLTGVDFDLGHLSLRALQAELQAAGHPYPFRFAQPPNSGVATGLDLDGDGRRGGPRDAQGYGDFAGAGGMAILSRLPLDTAGARDFSAFLWADLPGTLMPDAQDSPARAVQRLASVAAWDVPLRLPDGSALHLLTWHATPPVFDGPEDRNGRRNHDEAAFWLRLLSGELPFPPPPAPFVLLGDANLDPADGDGRAGALRALLADPKLTDPAPRGSHGRAEPGQSGDPALDTALYDPPLGGLRLDYVLPASSLKVRAAGVLWPASGDPLAAVLTRASHHAPVWVEVETVPP